MRVIRPRPQRSVLILSAVLVGSFVAMGLYWPGYVLWLLLGLLCVAVIYWARWRATQLEITEDLVRVRQGWNIPDRQAVSSEISAIHYFPQVISFRGPDQKPIMKVAPSWPMRQMVDVANELGVPLYDHRAWLGLRKVKTGRLVNSPPTPFQPTA